MNKIFPVQRSPHSHVEQVHTVNGAWDCDACKSIRPERMTFDYGMKGHHYLIANGIVKLY